MAPITQNAAVKYFLRSRGVSVFTIASWFGPSRIVAVFILVVFWASVLLAQNHLLAQNQKSNSLDFDQIVAEAEDACEATECPCCKASELKISGKISIPMISLLSNDAL